MSTKICPALENLSDRQTEDLESLISEKEELIGLIQYQWWEKEITVMTSLEKDSLYRRLDLYSELIQRVRLLTDSILLTLSGSGCPSEELSKYQCAYSLGNFLEDEFWDE